MSLLDTINKPNDIKNISPENYKRLAKEIRTTLVKTVSKTGGHLASNLGAVELTMALHLFLDFPEDKLIWDVGHQAYTHKLLTGRRSEFDTLRQFNGLSGFPKTNESPCDAFNTGHSSTSVSIADGMVKARDLQHKNYKVVAVIGDGALSGGMAYEALNNAGHTRSNMIIVLNDNNMSISENVGGVASYLGKIRTSSKYTGLKMRIERSLKRVPIIGAKMVKSIRTSKDSLKSLLVPGMLFENMGITYIGPIDGHNIPLMLNTFESASQARGPVLVHVITKKGKGYKFAESDPSAFHGVGPFNCSTGKPEGSTNEKTYTKVFSNKMLELGAKNEKIVAVSAAMEDGTGLKAFKQAYPERFVDVGIAEQHAVTFAAGMAAEGLHPIVAIYSTFLQRAYDQILHDVALNSLPVTFAIDRAGIVGKDGETHQGIFDFSYLSHIPNLVVMAPKNATELEDMLEFGASYNGPSAIRYPRGKATDKLSEFRAPISLGKSELLCEGNVATVFAVGRMVKVIYEICNEIKQETGLNIKVINARFISPIDFESVDNEILTSPVIITCEENVERGGYGEAIGNYLSENNYKGQFLNLSLPNRFLVQGSPNELRDSIDFSPEALKNRIKKQLTIPKIML